MAENETPPPAPPERPRAVRLTIAYNGDQIELVSQQSVAMKAPPSDPIVGVAERAGFMVDLKDAEDQTLYRRVLHDPIPRDVEVFSPDPRQTVQRAPVAEPRGVFSVVLPEMEAAQAVSLIGPPPPAAERGFAAAQAEAMQAPAREIARFELKPKP